MERDQYFKSVRSTASKEVGNKFGKAGVEQMSRRRASLSSAAESMSHHLSEHPAIKLDSDAAAPARSRVAVKGGGCKRANTHMRAFTHARTHAHT